MKLLLIIRHKIKICIFFLKKLLDLILGGIVFLPVVIVSPFFKVRVGELESRLIGHFSLPVELYLSDLELGLIKNEGKVFDIFFFNKKISNRFLSAKWSQLFNIYPAFPWGQLHYFLILTGVANSHLVPLRHWRNSNAWQIDFNQSLNKTKPHFKFSNEEIVASEKILNQLGINRHYPVVCFHIRDAIFHGNHIHNLNRRGPRDSKIGIFEKSMAELAANDINVIRVGRKMSQPIKLSKNLIDYAFSDLQDDMTDIYMMFKSDFIVGTLSGLENVGLMFRKKVCAINVSEWRVLDNFDFTQIPLFLPKKFIWKESSIPLTLSEIISTRAYEFNWNKQFEKSGILYKDNSPDDIADAVNQMLLFTRDNDKYLNLSHKDNLINDFLYALPARHGRKITSRLPLNYLQKNPHLLR